MQRWGNIESDSIYQFNYSSTIKNSIYWIYFVYIHSMVEVRAHYSYIKTNVKLDKNSLTPALSCHTIWHHWSGVTCVTKDVGHLMFQFSSSYSR